MIEKLTLLEQQTKALIKLCDDLKKENAYLRAKQASLQHECDRLNDQHSAIASKVNQTIQRLKQMEVETHE